jgi:RNA polymerase sigma-70 factor, ECF subfamily
MVSMTTAVQEEFALRVEPLRRELLAHCYQMLGSAHDAEDQLQETLLRAWRAYPQFDPAKASLRTWLHRIATNTCLTALTARQRRPLPSGLGGPSDDPRAALVPGADIAWLQPLADASLHPRPGGHASDNDPATRLLAKGRLRVAVIAALQTLPPRQRAAVILRDVLDWPIPDIAAALETSSAAVNSALQRARDGLARAGLDEESIGEPSDARQRQMIDRFVEAFERADLEAVRALLTADVVLEMPPFVTWYRGPDAYAGFLARVYAMRGRSWRLLRTRANGQSALGAYARGDDGCFHFHTLQVLGIGSQGIRRNTVYQDPGPLAPFQLPATLGQP